MLSFNCVTFNEHANIPQKLVKSRGNQRLNWWSMLITSQKNFILSTNSCLNNHNY